jgi:hypothetical protein
MTIVLSQDQTGAVPSWAAWNATTDDYDGAPNSTHNQIGYGAMHEEAIQDLLTKLPVCFREEIH